MRAFLTALLLIGSSTAGFAANYAVTDAVPMRPELSFGDVLKLAVPGLTVSGAGEATATETPPLPQLGDDESVTPATAEISTYSVEAVELRAGGIPYLAVVVSAGLLSGDGPAAMLAVFDMSSEPRLTDLLNVANDETTGFRDALTTPIGPEDDAIVLNSSHSNSNQGYNWFTVVRIDDGQVAEIASFPTLLERLCQGEREQQPSITTDAQGDGPWPITITVTEETRPSGEKCDDATASFVAGTVDYRTTYRWSSSLMTYVADDADGLTELATILSERY